MMQAMTVLALMQALAGVAAGDVCAVSAGDFLDQPADVFDQSPAGWRQLADRGCYGEAADLIETYRHRHAENLPPPQRRILVWHEGQMHAYANQYEAAAARFADTYPDKDEQPDTHYRVDAVIAFLNRDKTALIAAREALAALPEPPRFRAAVERIRDSHPDAEPPDWPLGLAEIDNKLRCFDYPYAVAYEGLCEDTD